MSYKKSFLNKSGVSSPISGNNSNNGAWNNSNKADAGYSNTDFGYKNYMSRLPEVYTGHPNRIERYNQYEMMDVDAEILLQNSALKRTIITKHHLTLSLEMNLHRMRWTCYLNSYSNGVNSMSLTLVCLRCSETSLSTEIKSL